MKVSIILATKDRPQRLPDAIASVMRQDDSRWELVVFDNGSMPVASLMPENDRIVYFHGSASGPADAYQQALERASGDLVIPMGDDDQLAPQTIRTIIERIGTHEWGYAKTLYLRDGQAVMMLGAPWNLLELKHYYYLGGAVFWRKTLSDRVGGFNSEYDGSADYELYLRFGETATPVYLADQTLYIYNDWEGTDSRRQVDRQRLATEKIWIKYPCLDPCSFCPRP